MTRYGYQISHPVLGWTPLCPMPFRSQVYSKNTSFCFLHTVQWKYQMTHWPDPLPHSTIPSHSLLSLAHEPYHVSRHVYGCFCCYSLVALLVAIQILFLLCNFTAVSMRKSGYSQTGRLQEFGPTNGGGKH